MRTAGNIAASLVGYGSIPVLGLVSGILTARMLGPNGRGELAAIQVIPSFLTIVAFLGTGQSITYYSAKKPQTLGTILGTALCMTLLWSVPVCAVGALLQSFALTSFRKEVVVTGLLFLLYIPLNLVNAAPWSTFQGGKRLIVFNGLRVQPQVIYLGVILFAFVLKKSDPSWIALGYLLGTLFVCVPTTWLLYVKLVGQPLKVDVQLLREILPYGLFSMFNYLPTALNQRIDQAFIAKYLTPQELGLYSVGSSLSLMISPILMAAGSMLFPYLAAQGEREAHKLFSFSIRWAFVLIVFLTVALYLLTPFLIVNLFGNDFENAIAAAKVLALAGGFMALNVVLSDGFKGLGRPAIPMIAEVTALVFTVGGLLLLLKPFGIIGAAYVSLGSYIISSIFMGAVFFKNVARSEERWVSAYQSDIVKLQKHIIAFLRHAK